MLPPAPLPVTLPIVLIGILSDTHGRHGIAANAVNLLHRRGAIRFIHCGDVGSPRVLDQLAGLEATFVTGNTDYDRQVLLSYGRRIGLEPCHPMADLTIGDKRIAVLHGDDSRLMHQLLLGQNYDYLLHGHTHIRDDRREGRTRIINPGALHRAAEKTVALLDLNADTVEFLVVAD